MYNKAAICKALKQTPVFAAVTPSDLKILNSKGLTHKHILIGDTGWLLRIPQGNQLGLDSAAYLQQQKACYQTAQASGHTPGFLDILPPSPALSEGALVIQAIKGRKPQLPQDWKAIAGSLAALHAIDINQNNGLEVATYPFAGQSFLLNTIFSDAYARAQLNPATRALIDAELEDINDLIEQLKDDKSLTLSLIGGDSHPANFMIDDNGKAWLVDLEYLAYDMAHIDLADAGLTITTRLEPDMTPCQEKTARQKFHDDWKKAAAPHLTDKADSLISLAERTVRARTLLWLTYWQTDARAEKAGKIPQQTFDNWDNMARAYLDPYNLKQLLAHGLDPALISHTPQASPKAQP